MSPSATCFCLHHYRSVQQDTSQLLPQRRPTKFMAPAMNKCVTFQTETWLSEDIWHKRFCALTKRFRHPVLNRVPQCTASPPPAEATTEKPGPTPGPGQRDGLPAGAPRVPGRAAVRGQERRSAKASRPGLPSQAHPHQGRVPTLPQTSRSPHHGSRQPRPPGRARPSGAHQPCPAPGGGPDGTAAPPAGPGSRSGRAQQAPRRPGWRERRRGRRGSGEQRWAPTRRASTRG